MHHVLQPIVDMRTGIVYAYEALLRGSREAGYPTIDSVFEDAAANGHSFHNELALYRLAISTFRRLPHADSKKLFINVDGHALNDASWDPQAIAAMVDCLGVERSAICMELSEKQQIGSGGLSDGGEHVQALRSTGLRIAVDDFGQGFSDLKLLYAAAPEYVKIDRFFINGLAESHRKRLFVTTVVNLAHTLGARVVAEGVETEEEFSVCRQIGCDLVQGWYIARPLADIENAPNLYPQARQEMARDLVPEDKTPVTGELDTGNPIAIDATLPDVFDILRSTPDRSLFAVVDGAGEPLGMIRERDFRQFVYSPFGQDSTIRQQNRPLRDFLRRVPVVEMESSLDNILESIALTDHADGVIVTRQMRYLGVLSPAAILKVLNDKRISTAQDQNPLSGLPGNERIAAKVAEFANRARATRLFAYFDFDNFKPFNDTYGFRTGDRVITLFSDILRRHLAGRDVFLGHVGGDDFVAARCGGDPDDFEDAVRGALEDFRQTVADLYDPMDRKRGFIRALDREGREQRYPLLTCSAAIVVAMPGRPVDTVDELTRWFAETKQTAKRADDGIALRICA